MSHIIQSLWIGPELSKLEQLCLKSFIDHGHEFHLYTYEEVGNVPDGVIIKDGNEILDKSEIFRYKNGSVSAFSNLFRFTLLHKKGGYWVDTDIICVRPFKFDEEIVIICEPSENYSQNLITSCFIKLPPQSDITRKAIEIQRIHKQMILDGRMRWSSGPMTVKEVVKIFKLYNYVKPWKTVCSCCWNQHRSLLDTSYKPSPQIISKPEEIPEEMVCIHLWHENWRREGIDKNKVYDKKSLYEYFKKKHGIM